jgi:hypothetical protein
MTRCSALLFLVLTAACSSTGASSEEPGALLAVAVESAGVVGNSANFEVSIANVSSETLTIRSVTVNPGVQRPMTGIPVTSTFTLEPGQEQTVLAEMRLNANERQQLSDWPDIVAVDVSYERNGKSEGHTFRVNVQPHGR